MSAFSEAQEHSEYLERSDWSVIGRSRLLGWTPARPADMAEYQHTMDYERPGDDLFLDALARECAVWLADNV